MAAIKIILVVAHEGYQPTEYEEPKKLLTTAGFDVLTASNKPGAAIAKDGSTTPVDYVLNAIKGDNYDGIFFIGGPGTLENLDNETSYSIIRAAAHAHKPLGAICIATRILAHAGCLTGVKATGWNDDHALEPLYKEYDVIYTPEKVVVDKNIITATGPSAAKEFGHAIYKLCEHLKAK